MCHSVGDGLSLGSLISSSEDGRLGLQLKDDGQKRKMKQTSEKRALKGCHQILHSQGMRINLQPK
jgi:hypothetical protein